MSSNTPSGSNLYSQGFGSTSSNSFPGNAIRSTRDPTSYDVRGPQGNYTIGQLWVNTSGSSYWGLVDLSSSNGTVSATWSQLTAGASGGVKTVNTILPDGSGDFEITAGSNITITPGTNSISIAATDTTGITTINTISPAGGGNFSITAGGGITITPGTNAITVATDGSHTTYNANTGSASPSSDVMNVIVASSNGTMSVGGASNTLSITTSSATGSNTAFGSTSLSSVSSGTQNTCIGASAGASISSGQNNTIIGQGSAFNAATGAQNTVVGQNALFNCAGGSNNVILGCIAGNNYTSTESNNIILGYSNSGTIAESNVLRIGSGTGTSGGQLNTAYISGINGNTLVSPNYVTIDAITNQLGTVSSVPPPSTTGTWTATFLFGGADTGNVYGAQTGTYIAIGTPGGGSGNALVVASVTLSLTTKGSATGLAAVGGLPFASSASFVGSGSVLASSDISIPSGFSGLSYFLGSSRTFVYLSSNPVNPSTGIDNLDNTVFQNTSSINLTVVYQA